MYRRAIASTVLAALAFPGLGLANPGPTNATTVSALALPLVEMRVSDPVAATQTDVRSDESASTTFAVAPRVQYVSLIGTGRGTTLESVNYRARRRSRYHEREYSEPSRSTGYAQIHGGFFDPEGEASNATVFGFRAGGSMDQHFQVGLGLDWQHRSSERSVVVREVPVPGGTAEQRLELGHQSSNLIPTMAFLQLSPGALYFGIGGGYEVLFLSAEDFTTGEQFDATYGGWGWQAWAGAAIPVANRTRLAAEVYTNSADVSRDVDDPTSGQTVREVIGLNGVGMRFGLAWGF